MFSTTACSSCGPRVSTLTSSAWWAGRGHPLPLPFARHGSLCRPRPALSDILIKRGANKHFGARARELIMNRFMSNDSISASLPCSPTPLLESGASG